MKLFRHKKVEPVISISKQRKEAVKLLEDAGYFVRKPRIRKPNIGDTVRFVTGAGWSINTRAYVTATVVSFGAPSNIEGAPHLKDTWVNVEKRNKKGRLIALSIVPPHMIVSVSKRRGNI